MEIEPDRWFQDKINPNLIQLHSIKEIIYTGRTRFQDVQIIQTSEFGKCLVLDGKIQSSELDEFIYHEALVQPAMIAHHHPGTVFIAGGGEGTTLREVLLHDTVKKAIMVDIDEEVIALCKRYLPEHSQGAFEDNRTELHHTDAREFLARSTQKYDVIIIDLPDPIEEGPAYRLYTREFYQLVKERLTDRGVISVQSGAATLTELLNFTVVYNTLKSVFHTVYPYQADVPSFGNPWGFCLASPGSFTLPSPDEINKRVSQRLARKLKFYDGEGHQGMFSLPKYLREALSVQKRLITDKEPLYIYRS